MASSNDNVSMALFCDFENVALGVRDANYEKFDIKPVLERLLLKGSIVVKKSYCDWDRYKGFKAPMHEANFELIEIPHVRQSGKNSADIRMVVDALDLCYTKSHVNTFVIISGDSDFSPLVSKLRENNKKVIGVGVKQSTSDLLVANCDEFIFYDDLVRESRRAAAKRDTREGQPAVKRTPEEENRRREEMDKRRREAVDMAVETFDALVSERGDSGKIWASVLKEAIKRRKPDFSESYYGFRTFGNLLEEAKACGLLEFGRDEKSGAYVYRSAGGEQGGSEGLPAPLHAAPAAAQADGGRHEGRRGRGRGRNRGERHAAGEAVSEAVSAELQLAQEENAYAEAEAVHAAEDADALQAHGADAPGGEVSQAGAEAEAGISTTSEQDDLDEEERALDEAAAAIANGTAPGQRQGRDGQGKRGQPKMPARQAKARQKAAQGVAAGDVWGKGKGRGKPAPFQAPRGQQAQPASAPVNAPLNTPLTTSMSASGGAPLAQAAESVPAVPVLQDVQPALPGLQPDSGNTAAQAPDGAAADAATAVPAVKGRARASAKGRAKAGEARANAAADAAAAEAPAPAPAAEVAEMVNVAEVAEAAAQADGRPAKPPRSTSGRRGAGKAKPAAGDAAAAVETVAAVPPEALQAAEPAGTARTGRGARTAKPARAEAPDAPAAGHAAAADDAGHAADSNAQAERKPAARGPRRPRKPA